MGELHTLGAVNIFVFVHHLLHHNQRLNTRALSIFIQGHEGIAATSTVRPGVHNSCPPCTCEHIHMLYYELSTNPAVAVHTWLHIKSAHPTQHHSHTIITHRGTMIQHKNMTWTMLLSGDNVYCTCKAQRHVPVLFQVHQQSEFKMTRTEIFKRKDQYGR